MQKGSQMEQGHPACRKKGGDLRDIGVCLRLAHPMRHGFKDGGEIGVGQNVDHVAGQGEGPVAFPGQQLDKGCGGVRFDFHQGLNIELVRPALHTSRRNAS